MSDPSYAPPDVCTSCGQPLRPGARFCGECGARVVTAQPPAPPQQPEPPVASPARPQAVPSQPPAPPGSPPGYQITLQAVAPAARGRVLQTLRQALGLNPRDAQTYVAAAPVLLAVGLTPDMAERLRLTLVSAGAVVSVHEPPAPQVTPAVVEVREPAPEPIRRMAATARTVRQTASRPGLRTVTGLDLGHTYSYLAYARAEGQEMVTPPDLVRFEAQTSIPSAIRLAGEGRGMSFGNGALTDWLKQPEAVQIGFLEAVGVDDGSILPVARNFIEALARRLSEVLGPEALAGSGGASAALGIPAGWDESRADLLLEAAAQAGFPVSMAVPQPLAALAHHRQQGTLRPARTTGLDMVVDWGGSGLRTSFVERGGDLAEPVVFEHVELPLGGDLFDALLLDWLVPQLPPELNDEDGRALALFARDFKNQMSRSFAEGKSEHAQYCVIPAGAPPMRVRLGRSEFEKMSAEIRAQFQQVLLEAVGNVGLENRHIEQVILVGGSGRWYFAREAIRSTLGRVPLVGTRPEEAVARGLAVYGLTF